MCFVLFFFFVVHSSPECSGAHYFPLISEDHPQSMIMPQHTLPKIFSAPKMSHKRKEPLVLLNTFLERREALENKRNLYRKSFSNSPLCLTFLTRKTKNKNTPNILATSTVPGQITIVFLEIIKRDRVHNHLNGLPNEGNRKPGTWESLDARIEIKSIP